MTTPTTPTAVLKAITTRLNTEYAERINATLTAHGHTARLSDLLARGWETHYTGGGTHVLTTPTTSGPYLTLSGKGQPPTTADTYLFAVLVHAEPLDTCITAIDVTPEATDATFAQPGEDLWA